MPPRRTRARSWRQERGWPDGYADPKRNFSNGLRRKTPDVALPYLKRIYRTLLTRPTQSCSVFCVDAETRAHLADRIVRP